MVGTQSGFGFIVGMLRSSAKILDEVGSDRDGAERKNIFPVSKFEVGLLET